MGFYDSQILGATPRRSWVLRFYALGLPVGLWNRAEACEAARDGILFGVAVG